MSAPALLTSHDNGGRCRASEHAMLVFQKDRHLDNAASEYERGYENFVREGNCWVFGWYKDRSTNADMKRSIRKKEQFFLSHP